MAGESGTGDSRSRVAAGTQKQCRRRKRGVKRGLVHVEPGMNATRTERRAERLFGRMTTQVAKLQ
jgi:hypothetical protein